MNHGFLITTLTAAILFAPAVFAQDTKPMPADPAASTEKCPAKCMTQMQDNMKIMQMQMEKMRATTDPQARQELMQKHMQTMQENMQMMNNMGGGMMGGSMKGGDMKGGSMMGGDPNQRLEMMEKRLDMMQMMMDQMMQHDQMMEPMPAK